MIQGQLLLLDGRNLSPLLWTYDTTVLYVIHSSLKCHFETHDCFNTRKTDTKDEQKLMLSSFNGNLNTDLGDKVKKKKR